MRIMKNMIDREKLLEILWMYDRGMSIENKCINLYVPFDESIEKTIQSDDIFKDYPLIFSVIIMDTNHRKDIKCYQLTKDEFGLLITDGKYAKNGIYYYETYSTHVMMNHELEYDFMYKRLGDYLANIHEDDFRKIIPIKSSPKGEQLDLGVRIL